MYKYYIQYRDITGIGCHILVGLDLEITQNISTGLNLVLEIVYL